MVIFYLFIEDESSVKSTGTKPIFNEFTFGVLLVQKLNPFTGK